ncbi:MAG TPA: two-component regulator propeller domain-containing protein [Flavobacteriales bacterium]|nr:two-component regulator propeller domain-containing protein [Flavobacteriales bacterium]
MAQGGVRDVRMHVTALTVEDGLPQGQVTAILEDRTGFLWFGTKDGLARYDGYSFKVFRHDAADSTSLCGNHIISLLEDRDGHIWVGTLSNGTCLLDPRTGIARHISPLSPRKLLQDGRGAIWMVDDGGAIHVLGSVEQGFQPLAGLCATLPDMRKLGDLGTDASGRVWAMGHEHLLAFLPDRSGGYVIDRTVVVPSHEPGINERPLQQLVEVPDAHRLLLVNSREVFDIDPVTGQLSDPMATAGLYLWRCELVDREGRLWCNLEDASTVRLDLGTGVAERIQLIVANAAAGSERPVGSGVLQDRNGAIWFTSSGFGATCLSASAQRFRAIPGAGVPVRSKALGALEVGAFELTISDGSRTPEPLRRRLSELGYRIVHEAFALQRSEQLCIIARPDRGFDAELLILDTLGQLFRPSLGGSGTPSQLLPGRNGDLLVGCGNRGGAMVDHLAELDPLTLKVTARYALPRPMLNVDYRPIGSCSWTSDGRLWLGTYEGLLCLDTRTGEWETFVNTPLDPLSLPGNMVLATCLDPSEPDERVWVGTEGNGLAVYDRRTRKFTRYTTEGGLPNNVIYGILPGAAGELWLSTNQGLCRFEPRTGATRNFTTAQGLPGNEFNRYSALQSMDGTLTFGGMSGAVDFDPADFLADTLPSPTVITSLRLRNQRVDRVSRPDLLRTYMPFVERIELPYDERMVAFTFSSMDHSAAARNSFRYMLEGAIDEWVESGTAREATFTNLDPGSYTFRVQGRNSMGVWDPVGASVLLVVTPPWWGTWWFRALLVLVVAGALYALYRYRLAQQLRLAHVRDRIARDLHDEIGSTLSSVALHSEVALREGPKGANGHAATLARISESTSEMMESMNDIVWAVNSRNDDLLHVVQRMRAFAARMAEGADLMLDFQVDEALTSRPLSMVQRKNLYLVFKEAVNNAAKYSGGSKLSVRLEREEGELVLTVEDDGVGFDHAMAGASTDARGGNGLESMQARAAEIKGTIRVETRTGTGTRVQLRFKP